MKMTWGIVGALALAAAAFTAPASAADLGAKPVYTKAPVAYDAWSPWMIRVRALGVIPDDRGTINLVGNSLSYSNAVVPELDITYFFTKNIAAELILGVTKHSIYLDPAGTKVGSTWLLPPTLTLQYHFTDFGAFKPYVGAGVNYTVAFSEKAYAPLTQIDVKNAFGVAAQIGFDYMLDKNWGLNFDVKKLWLNPGWSANNGALFGKTRLDPWLIGGGITYRFGSPVVARY